MADESGDRGSNPGGFGDRDSGRSGGTELGGTRGRGRADISATTPGSFGESFGPNDYGRMSRENQQIFDQLHREHIESLSAAAMAGRFGREVMGMNPGAFGFSEWGHPAGRAMDLAEKGLGLIGGPLGALAGRAARGLSEISTGSNADFGGGFGVGDRSAGGLGVEGNGTPSMGETLAQMPTENLQSQIANVSAQRAMLMQDFWKEDRLNELRQMLAEIEQMRQQMAPGSRPTPNVRI